MKYLYDHELGVAGIQDSDSGIGVYTLVQQAGIKKAAFNAYSGARYSRSSNNIFEILRELVKTAVGKGITSDEHAADRVEQIVNSYGHPSVADMSHNFICVENVPMITIMRFFYLNAKQDGQERSTRFQNFSTPNFWIPNNQTGNEKYEMILHDSINAYNELKDETYDTFSKVFEIDQNNKDEVKSLEARTFDTLRHFIPMAMRTSGCAIMSSRDWSRYIGTLKGSDQIVEQKLGDLLYTLLVGTEELTSQGYVPESDILIRHAEANDDSFNTIQCIKNYFKNGSHVDWGSVKYSKENNGAYMLPAPIAFADHIAMLVNNKSITSGNVFKNKKFFELASGVIFEKHYHYNQVGPVFQMGSICIKGHSDVGALKDFNRQRSLERFVPFYENTVEKAVLLENGYGLCQYLYQPGLEALRAKYEKHFNAIYKNIRLLNADYRNVYTVEEIRYLLPHGHMTPYNMYGSLDDLLYVEMLRIKPGGHINYRMEAWQWRDAMINSDIFGLPEIWSKIPIQQPNPLSRTEFISRA